MHLVKGNVVHSEQVPLPFLRLIFNSMALEAEIRYFALIVLSEIEVLNIRPPFDTPNSEPFPIPKTGDRTRSVIQGTFNNIYRVERLLRKDVV